NSRMMTENHQPHPPLREPPLRLNISATGRAAEHWDNDRVIAVGAKALGSSNMAQRRYSISNEDKNGGRPTVWSKGNPKSHRRRTDTAMSCRRLRSRNCLSPACKCFGDTSHRREVYTL